MPVFRSLGRDPVALTIEKYLSSHEENTLCIKDTADGIDASFSDAKASAETLDIALIKLGALLLSEERFLKPLVRALRGPIAISAMQDISARRQAASR